MFKDIKTVGGDKDQDKKFNVEILYELKTLVKKQNYSLSAITITH